MLLLVTIIVLLRTIEKGLGHYLGSSLPTLYIDPYMGVLLCVL